MNENFMRNMKVVNYCWTCHKVHNIGDRHPSEKPIMCECGGYVVTPSGKVQFAILPVTSVFKVDDGERHWIAAKDVDEVRTVYNAVYDETLEDDAVIEPVALDVLRHPFISTEEGRKVSLIDIIRDQNDFPALLASSVW